MFDLSTELIAKGKFSRNYLFHHLISFLGSLIAQLDPPFNLTSINTNSSSFVIHWRPYSGKATLLGYRVLVLSLGPRGHRLKRATTQLNGELIHNFTVDTNVTSIGIGNLSAFSKYCVQIGLIVVEGNGGLSKCFYFDTEGSKS